MRFKAIFIWGLLLYMTSGNAFGQTPLPWDVAETPSRSASGEILESQLPIVRASLETPGDVWVGQAVSLNVEVIVPTWFTGSPKFPDIEIENALVLSTGDAVNAVVQSGGKTFSGQDRQYLVFPQTAGAYTIPAVKVTTSYALPDGKPSPPAAYASFPLTFIARVPPAAAEIRYFLTTDRFTIQQSFDRKLDGLKVGNAITRTVHMTAENTAAMMLPALTFEAPDGIRCYPGEAKTSDKAERGVITATREETVTYVLTQPGHYRLPGIDIKWWAPRAQKMNPARLGPVDFRVTENPGLTSEVFSSSADGFLHISGSSSVFRRLTPQIWALLLSGSVLLLLSARRLLSRNRSGFRQILELHRKKKAEAETTFFKRFRKASVSNDACGSLREMMFWLDRIIKESDVASLSRFAKSSGMTGLLLQCHILQAFLYTSPEKPGPFVCRAGWVGKPLYRMVARARRALRKRVGATHSSKIAPFELNPDKGRDCSLS